MRKSVFVLILLAALTCAAFAQTTPSGPTLPPTCTGVQEFNKTTAPIGRHQCINGVWTPVPYTFSLIGGKPTTLLGYGIADAQPLSTPLTQISALSPSNDDILQRKAGAWTNRTIAQVKSDFGLAAIATSGSANDMGTGTIPDARFPSTLPALNGSALTNLNASNLASGTVPLGRLSGITNTEISNSAAIAYSKLNLTGSILNADLAGSIDLTTKVTGALPITNGGTNATSATNARANLGLVIGTDVAPVASPTFTGTVSAPLLNLTGTAGGGYIQIANQASAPSTPTSAGRIYFDSTNRFSWKGTNGLVRSFDGTANTADRMYTLPDADSKIPIFAQTITFAGPTASRTVTLPDANFTAARTDAANTFSGLQSFSNSADAQGTFSGWDVSNGANSQFGQINLGSNATFQGRIHYSNGVMYVDNAWDSASGNILFRTRTNGSVITPLSITGAGIVSIGGRLTVTDATQEQLILTGWDSTGGANTQFGELRLGSVTTFQGRHHYSNGVMYIDNTYDNAAGNILFRTRLNGTPVSALSILGTGAVGVGTAAPGATLTVAGNWNSTQTTVSFSATPTFAAASANHFKITLTSNVTSSTLSGQVAGQVLTFTICQDATGSRTFVWPTNVKGGMVIGSDASKCNVQTFISDGTTAYASASGVTNQ